MKKILSVFAVVLLLCTTFCFTASAGDWVYTESQDKAVIVGNGENIVYKGETYIKTDIGDATVYNDDYDYLNHIFENDKFENKYEYFEVLQPCDYILIASYNINGIYREDYYILDSHLAQVNAFVNGEYTDSIKAEHPYGLELMDIPIDIIKERVTEENRITVDGSEVQDMYDECTWLVNTDEGGNIYRETGLILRKNNFDEFEDEYYVLFYSEHDRSSFYAGNNFALGEEGVTTHLYFLGSTKHDPQLAELSTRWDTMPDDELDWMFSELPPVFTILLCILLLGLAPLAAIVFAVIKLFIKPTKYGRGVLFVMLIAGVIVIAASVIILMMLF